MRTTSADVLEFESLAASSLGRYISSPLGQAELENVQPHTDRERLDEDLAEAEEATEYLRAAARPQQAARGAAIRINFSSIPDLTEAVHKLRIEGAVLEPEEIVDVLTLLDRAADVTFHPEQRLPKGSRAWGGARNRSANSARCSTIWTARSCPTASVADHASVALGRLRRDIERQKKSIQESLERFLRAHHEEGVLQEEFVTIRNERFVVPVIAGPATPIDGVIHGASAQRPYFVRRAARNHRPE